MKHPVAICALAALARVGFAADATAPDYKALYEKANESARLWKEKAEALEKENAALVNKVDWAEARAQGVRDQNNQYIAALAPPLPDFSLEPQLPTRKPVNLIKPDKQEGHPITVRQSLPFNTWLHLSDYGGPNTHMMITNVQMTYFTVMMKDRKKPQEFPITKDERILVYDDGRGCKTYFVNDPIHREGNHATFEFEHTANSLSYPQNARAANSR
jgi:hypothetical protein